MKKLLLLFTLCGLFSAFVSAQNISCSDFNVVSLRADNDDSTLHHIRIWFGASNQDFINYPVVSCVLDCNGDTVATGKLNFFGQIGQTEQEYPVTIRRHFTCRPLTIIFIYGDNQGEPDTCYLNYGSTSVKPVHAPNISIYPNPGNGRFTLKSPANLEGPAQARLYSPAGQLVFQQAWNSFSHEQTLDLSHLASGVYLLQFYDGIKTQALRLVIE